jgi:cell division protein FtsI/penicillin-binding protein 2
MLGTRVSGTTSRARRVGSLPKPAQPKPTKTPAARLQRAEADRSRAREHSQILSTASRPLVLLIVLVLCAGALMSRLVFWQVMQHGHLSAVASQEHGGLNVQVPLRGEIVDAAGNPLAMDVTMNDVTASPKHIKDPSRTAQLLAPVLGQSAKRLFTILTSDTPYALLAPRVDETTSQKIRNLALPGIVLDPQVGRDYPDGQVASQVLGYTDTSNRGQFGVEGHYDPQLSGTAGLRSVIKDTAGNDIRLSSGSASPAHNGAELQLTIDPTVQSEVEAELQKAVKKHTADGGTAIVMDPRSGYVLAMASTPSYNPNHYERAANGGQASLFLNPAIQWQYEPGSTFKIITMAAGLDTHVITPQSAFNDTGVFPAYGVAIRNWNDGGFGWENMTQVLQHSANVGASWVANRLQTKLFYKYIRRFQFGRPTGVDLQDEWPGIVPFPGSKNWSPINLYTNSYGQGIAITPLQLARATATVANNGVMMKPQVVKQMIYDGRIFDRKPVSQGRVVSVRTAHTLTNMLVHSAIGGEAALGLVKGYNIAAKTGTANIAGPDGGYIQGATIASIVGYAPAFNPRFVVVVIIRHPRDTPWGSMAAAPVLHNLFQYLFVHYHIPPSPHAINP